MLNTLLSLFQSGSQAFKIQNVDRSVRVGIVVKDFDELMKKGCLKLKIPSDDVKVVLESDGTLIENNKFFFRLRPHTVLIFLRKDETWTGSVSRLREALNTVFDTRRKEELEVQIRELLAGDDASAETMNMMARYLELLDTNIDAETKEEDEEWFGGYGSRFKTKSQAMKSSARSRIRSYYNGAKKQIDRDYKGNNKILLEYVLDQLSEKLQRNKYHGAYFSRKSKKTTQRLCDTDGWFTCEGAFDEKSCDQYHKVNPYSSLGHRQLFSLWNLDHVIEKSREIVPTLIEAADNLPEDMELNADHVYSLLFTRANLKLVHIGCHKKASRPQNQCKLVDFYI